MKTRYAIAGLILAATMAAGASYLVMKQPQEDAVVDATDCDSCAARKQRLKEVRQALNPPASASE